MAKFSRTRFSDSKGRHCDVTIYTKNIGGRNIAEVVFGLEEGRETFVLNDTDRISMFAVHTFVANGIANVQQCKAIREGNPVPEAYPVVSPEAVEAHVH